MMSIFSAVAATTAPAPAVPAIPAIPAISVFDEGEKAHPAGLLWKASSNKGTLYLVGSIQATLPKGFVMPAYIEAAFSRSSALIVEQLPSSEEQGLDAFLDDHGAYPPGDDIFRHLPSRYADKLRKFAQAKELPVDNLGTLRPWIILLMTDQWPLITSATSAVSGIEGHFLHKAQGKKPIYGIETERFEDGLLASIPEGIQAEVLQSFLDAPSKDDLAEAKVSAWLAGNVSAVFKGEIGFLDRYSAVRRTLLEDRNAGMAQFAAKKLKAGGTWFMCVNATHMLGPSGIVARLRAAGIQVTAEGS